MAVSLRGLRESDRGIRVLCADASSGSDDVGVRLGEYSERFTVESVTTVAAALAAFDGHDAVVSRYELDDGDGIALLEEFRADHGAEVPFVLFTDADDPDVLRAALNGGADRHLHRSSDADEQFATLASELEALVADRRERRRRLDREREYAEILENLQEGYYRTAPDGTVTMITPSSADILGYDPEEIVGRDIMSFYPDDAQRDIVSALETDGGAVDNFEVQLEHRDGSRIDVVTSSHYLREDGEIVGLEGIFRDITERKETERALRESQRRLSAVYQSSPTAITLSTLEEGRYVEVNQAFTDITGWDGDEVVGRTAAELGLWADDEDREAFVADLRSGGAVYDREFRFRDREGEEIVALTSADTVDIDGETYILASTLDITEQKERERRLQRQNERLEELVEKHERAETRYRSLFDNNPIPIWEEDFSAAKAYLDELAEQVVDVSAHLAANPDELWTVIEKIDIIDVNENALDYYGADSKAQLLDNLGTVFTEESREANCEMLAAIAAGETTFRTETVSQTLDGERRDEILELQVPDAYAEDYSRVYLTATDITERVERERELESYEVLFENTLDCIVETEFVEGEPVIRDVNAAFEKVFGYDAESVRGERLDDVIAPEQRRDEATSLSARAQAGETFTKEVTRMTADGPREFLLRPAHYEEEMSYAIYTDISERVERERQLQRQNERLGAIFENISEAVIEYTFTDGQPVIRTVNEAFEDVFGYDAESVRGEPVDDVIVPTGRRREATAINERIRGGDPVSQEVERETVDGTRTFLFRNAPIETDDETRGFAIYTDISERRERERRLELYRAYVEYQDKTQKLSEARVDLSVIEAERSDEELEESDEYARLATRIDELESELADIEAMYDSIPDDVV